MSKKKLSVIGVPIDMGAGVMGTRLGPDTIRLTGVLEDLGQLGWDVEDKGNIPVDNLNTPKVVKHDLDRMEIVYNSCKSLAKKVSDISQESTVLVLGGDHSIVLGTAKGLMDNYKKLGVLYLDAHGDINTDETTPSGNLHGKPLASLIGFGDNKMANLHSEYRLLPENLAYIGLRDVDCGEKTIIKDNNILAYSTQDIDHYGIKEVLDNVLNQVTEDTDGFMISFDIDCLNPLVAPGTGINIPGGLDFRDVSYILSTACKHDKFVGLEVVELNPLKDKFNMTGQLVRELLLHGLGPDLI